MRSDIPSCHHFGMQREIIVQEEHFPSTHFIRYSGYPSPTPSFRAQQEIFLALCSFLLLSQKVSPFPLSHIRRYTSVPERSLDFARDDDTGIAFSKHIRCTLREINTFFPHTVISSTARNLFRPLFPTTPSLSRLREAPSPPFLRYGVSHFSLSGMLPFTANEKDPSASLGMTIRETCFLNTIFSRSTEVPISRLFTSLSFISRL